MAKTKESHAAYMREWYHRRWAEIDAMPKVPCACGCGTLISPLTRKFKPATYAPSHHPGGRITKGDVREANPAWKGGRVLSGTRGSYVRILVGDVYVYEHRLVMAEALGRALQPDEVVHHRNGVRDDNRLENLELFENQANHMSHHQRGGA